MSTEFERNLRQMSEKFRADLPARHGLLSTIFNQVLDDKSIPTCQLLKQKLHQLTGSAGTFGLRDVSNASREFEMFTNTLCRTNEILDTDTEKLHTFFEQLTIQIDVVTAHNFVPEISSLSSAPTYKHSNTDTHKKIVIFDDDKELHFYQSILTEQEFDITLYNTPKLDILKDIQPSLLLVNITLNNENNAGTDFIRKLQEHNATLPPVIFISAIDDFEIRLEAVRAGGTRFLVSPFPDDYLLNSVHSLTKEDTEPYRILIIDDEVEVTDYFSAVLNNAGMVVSSINSPFEAIEKVKQFRPELIVLDLHMTGCNGLELAAMIRHQEDYSKLPIVFLSADDALENRLSAMSLDVDDFIPKGMDTYQIIASIKSRVKKSRLVNTLTQKLMAAREKAEKANESKSHFLSFVSHELKTPLNAILGYTDLLKFDALSEEQKETIADIHTCGKMQLDLIHDLLDLTMIEEGKVTLNITTLYFNDLINSSMSLISTQAKTLNLSLDVEMPDEIVMEGDQKRIQQILLNLLSNAVKYNKENGSIKVSVTRTEDDIQVAVIDTGKGMTEACLSTLFNPFERAGAEKTEIEGTGLGMGITKSLIELMKGQISVTSQLNEGSTFTVTLPCI